MRRIIHISSSGIQVHRIWDHKATAFKLDSKHEVMLPPHLFTQDQLGRGSWSFLKENNSFLSKPVLTKDIIEFEPADSGELWSIFESRLASEAAMAKRSSIMTKNKLVWMVIIAAVIVAALVALQSFHVIDLSSMLGAKKP